MVPGTPPRLDPTAEQGPLAEGPRALPVLRDPRKPGVPLALLQDGLPGLVQVVGAAIAKGELGPALPGRQPAPLADTPPQPQGRRRRSESLSRGAGCGKSARPDLRGAGRGNPPVYPTAFPRCPNADHQASPTCATAALVTR